MSKIILFNSPRNVGKSKVIGYLNSEGYKLIPAECKQSLHHLTMTLFGVEPKRYWEIYNTRELKEVPLPEFFVCLTDCYEEYCDLEDILGYSLQGTNLEDKEAYENNWELRYKDVPENHYSTALNLSIREAMIYVSELVVKPRWGADWFGKERVRKMKTQLSCIPDRFLTKDQQVFTDDSAAFVDELHPLIEYLGQENILLLRIHREGFTFDGDSRSYIPDGIIDNTIDVYNNGTEQEYFDQVEEIVKGWLND